MSTIKLIDKARTQIITKHAFFSSILLKRTILEVQSGTASMDRGGTIRYNPAWIESEKFDAQMMVFLLCHECMHYMFMHTWRRGSRNHSLFNDACDAVINETLIKMNVGKFIEGGIRWPGAEDMNAEEVYELMLKQQQDSGESPDGNKGGGSIGPDLAETGDGDPETGEGEGQPVTAEQLAAQEAAVKVDIAQARNAAKQIGQMHGLMDRIVAEILTTKVPWYEYMERFFTRQSDNDFSYEKCDRRYMSRRLWLPGLSGFGMGTVCIIVDVSGSVSARELAEFSANINKILEACMPEKTVVIFCHSRVVGTPMEYGPDEFPIRLSCPESGGTDMTKGIDYVMEHHPDADEDVRRSGA